MTKVYDGWTINTGFLGGNLFVEDGDDRGTYDIGASAARYAEMCREALEREFPGADIRIQYEVMASGAIPLPMRTYVRTPDGMEYYPGDHDEAGAIAERVDNICGEVWESWEWVVYEEDAR